MWHPSNGSESAPIMESIASVSFIRAPQRMAGQPVGGAAHRLGPAGHRDVAVTQHDHLGGGDDGLHRAAAQPVQGQRGRADVQAAVDGRYPGQVHVPLLGVDAVAEYGMTHLGRLDARPADRLADHLRGQVTGRYGGQAAAVLADRGPDGGQDEYVFHCFPHLPCRGHRRRPGIGASGRRRGTVCPAAARHQIATVTVPFIRRQETNVPGPKALGPSVPGHPGLVRPTAVCHGRD